MIMLATGTKAPDFTLADQDGRLHSLSDYRGRKVILYFYPKDNTSGCTKQACGFGELYPHFREKNAEIIGISKDSTDSHRRFADKYQLPFILLSDPDTSILQLYEAWGEKSMYGRKFMGVVRTTYLIDEEGTVIKAFGKVSASENPAQMLNELQQGEQL